MTQHTQRTNTSTLTQKRMVLNLKSPLCVCIWGVLGEAIPDALGTHHTDTHKTSTESHITRVIRYRWRARGKRVRDQVTHEDCEHARVLAELYTELHIRICVRVFEHHHRRRSRAAYPVLALRCAPAARIRAPRHHLANYIHHNKRALSGSIRALCPRDQVTVNLSVRARARPGCAATPRQRALWAEGLGQGRGRRGAETANQQLGTLVGAVELRLLGDSRDNDNNNDNVRTI